jgi:hypothetical protein
MLTLLLLLLLQVFDDSLAGCIVTATYNTISAAAKGGRTAMATLTDRGSLVKIYKAAYDACAPQARRRSLQQAGFFSRMTDDQYTARQALFNATAAVSDCWYVEHNTVWHSMERPAAIWLLLMRDSQYMARQALFNATAAVTD